jgi:superfamily II DNA or RNA helicase
MPATRTAPKRLSRTQKPHDLSLEQWQIELRRQFAEKQGFLVETPARPEVFGPYSVHNPLSGRTYRVTIRGLQVGENQCECPDFATNTLGTCKHIEFVIFRLRKNPKSYFRLKRGYQPESSEVWLHYGTERAVMLRRGVAAPAAFHTLAARHFDEAGRLKAEAFGHFDEFLRESAALGHAVDCHDAALHFIAEVRDGEHRQRHLEQRAPACLDGLLKATLYPYQREGVLFAARAGRSVLGDDMGLGKTVQALGFAELMAREFGTERVLIVCPASLKFQWKQEIERFTHGRQALVVTGALHERHEQYAAAVPYTIVNYDVLRRDVEAINRQSFDIIILDEAQRIKNWKTRTAQCVKSLESPYALVLTGTPLENRIEELHSIVQFVDQHRLGPLFRFLDNHQVTDRPGGRVTGYRNLSSIGESLQPILLRRRKSEVLLQLPERIDKNFFVPMTPQQLHHHEENRELVARLASKWRRYHFLSESDQRKLMIALQRMRMACDSTYLVDHQTRDGQKIDELMVLLDEILENPAEKVVIFSQWQRMHELVAEALEARGVRYEYLHGGVPSGERGALVQRFREEPAVRVFLSTDAGGVGLNLQMAATVVNLDLPWNPAVLEQRIARVHRLGQQKAVAVINFVAEGTIEHGMLDVIQFKRGVFAGVLDGGQDEVFMSRSRFEKFMETVEAVSEATPETLPETGDGPGWVSEDADDVSSEPAASGSVADADEMVAAQHEVAVSVTAPAPAPAPSPAPAASSATVPSSPTVTSSDTITSSGAVGTEALAPLLAAGAGLLQEVSRLLGGSADQMPRVERDEVTGKSCLRVPLGEDRAVEGLQPRPCCRPWRNGRRGRCRRPCAQPDKAFHIRATL